MANKLLSNEEVRALMQAFWDQDEDLSVTDSCDTYQLDWLDLAPEE
ncbi:hypothetical protein J3L16_06665 [Alteromonas sp. 5E99-2]|nr:hypothetical protein [Alteromonas sp. 5E99-2]MBO1255364.1 hypothetical protein [Alteromonas sp. 5E99-2]